MTLKRIILWQAFILAAFLPASALTVTVPENHAWEIFNTGYDAAEAPVTIELNRRVKIVEKSSGTVSATRQMVWLGDAMAEERDATNTVTKRFYGQGEQISGASYYYTLDHLGSVREMLDSTQTVQARYDYDPYGRATLVSGSNLSDFQYAGYYTHQPSTLNLTKYRAYNPATASWLSRDPIVSTNLYAYCHNDPLNHTDPLGLCDEDKKASGGGTTVEEENESVILNDSSADHWKRVASNHAEGEYSAEDVDRMRQGLPPLYNYGTPEERISADLTREGAAEAEGVEIHHLFPQQYRKEFEDAGIDIDAESSQTILPKSLHTGAPDGVHAGPSADSWNGQWKKFFETPNRTKQQILDQLAKMRAATGI